MVLGEGMTRKKVTSEGFFLGRESSKLKAFARYVHKKHALGSTMIEVIENYQGEHAASVVRSDE